MQIGFCVLPLALAYSVASVCAALPRHPTVVSALYKKQELPVIDAKKEQPVIMVDGKRLTLPITAPMFANRAASYGPANAVLSDFTILKSEDRYKKVDGSAGTSDLAASLDEFSVMIKADRDLTDCYLLIVDFVEDFLTDPQVDATPQINIRKVPDLKADTPQLFMGKRMLLINKRYSFRPGTYRILSFVQLFSQGKEVKTPVGGLPERFYREREIRIHSALLEEWRAGAKGRDRALKPFLQIPPLLESTKGLPADGLVRLEVSSAGIVTDVTLEGSYPAEAAEVLRDTFSAWLFLPKITLGLPQASSVSIPLRF